MSNLNSTDIRVFPTTTRTQVDPQSRLMTEYNLTSLINRLVDKDGFVITSNLGDALFQFNIQGYIFSVGDPSDGSVGISKLLPSTDSKDYAVNEFLVASITINRTIGTESENNSQLRSWAQLVGDDSSSGYSGVSFDWTTSDPQNEIKNENYTYKLAILECVSINGNLPANAGDEFKENATVSNAGKFFKLDGNIIFAICENSKIKFETNKEGTNRSVRIDDGELN